MTFTTAVLSRRSLLLAAVAGVFGTTWWPRPVLAASKAKDPAWDLSDADWRQRLSPEAYQVLRNEGTERPFTSPFNDEKRSGNYHCAGCDLALFSSEAKFDSGTGWPSFFQPLEGAIETKAVWPRAAFDGAPTHHVWIQYHSLSISHSRKKI